MKRLAHYSQYFLRSPRLTKELLGHTNIARHDVVFDIGAGSGILSSILATRVKKVVAVEYEPRMVEKLRANMQKHPNVTVLEADFLTMPLPKTPYKVFANIPFHLSSPIVRKLTEATHPPEAIYLIVQKQFANKLLPDSDRFTGQLGMLVGPLFAVRIRRRLRRTDFWPHPNVDTVLLEILRREKPLITQNRLKTYRSFTEACFSDPNVFAQMPLARVELPLTIKPSQMKLEQWISLFNAQQRY